MEIPVGSLAQTVAAIVVNFLVEMLAKIPATTQGAIPDVVREFTLFFISIPASTAMNRDQPVYGVVATSSTQHRPLL